MRAIHGMVSGGAAWDSRDFWRCVFGMDHEAQLGLGDARVTLVISDLEQRTAASIYIIYFVVSSSCQPLSGGVGPRLDHP